MTFERTMIVPADLATTTQRVIDLLGGFVPVAKILTTEMGYTFSRQAIYAWYVQGHVPLAGHADTIRILVDACQHLHGEVISPESLEREVPVPANRIPA